MTENEAYKVFEDVELHGYGLVTVDELKEAAAVFLNLITELRRFREREPLVQAALQDAKGYSQFEDLHDLVTKALDFDLRSQCVAENSDTGDDSAT